MDSKTQAALAIAVQANVPVIGVGGAGIGKTSQIKYLARLLDWYYYGINPSSSTAIDLSMPSAEYSEDYKRRVLEATPWKWALEMAQAQNAIFLVDEFNTGDKQMEAALMRPILEAMISDIYLGPGARRVALMNPATLATNGSELSGPTANRFCWLQMNPVFANWKQGKLTGEFPMSMPILPPNWERYLPQATSLIVSFLETHGHLFYAEPTDPARLAGPWPSPRTWDMAIRLLAACFSLKLKPDNEVTQLLINGCVGPGEGAQFTAWTVAAANIPTPAQMWAQPAAIELPLRDDLLTTALNSLVTAMVDSIRNDSKEQAKANWAATWKIIGRVADDMQKREIALGGAVPLKGIMPADFKMPPEGATLFGIAVSAKAAADKAKARAGGR